LGLAWLITLAAAFVTGVNVHGQRLWRVYQRQALARGDRLDVASLAPRAVPEEQNFAMTPLLAPLFEYQVQRGLGGVWRNSNAVNRLAHLNIAGGTHYPGTGSWRAGELADLSAWQAHYRKLPDFPSTPQPQSPGADVLLALSKFEAQIAELRLASERPQARFPLHYEEGMFMLYPHFPAVLNLLRVAQLRALAELAEGQEDAALADARLALRLAESLRDEPLLVAQLKRAAFLELALQPLWEGLARHRWSDNHLRQWEQDLAKVDLLEGLEQAVHYERNWAVGHSLPGHPWVFGGYIKGNQAIMGQILEERLLPIVRAREHRVDVGRIRSDLTRPGSQPRLTLYFGRHLAALLMPAVARGAISLSARQTAVDQARIACALERYRLRHQQLPDTLEVLQPEFIERLPHDLVTGQPMRYRRYEAGGFTLYSVGLNAVDDGGQPAWRSGPIKNPDFERGDWAWSQP
jgi:hypothetical protein